MESQEERVEIIATRGPTVKNVGFLRVKGTAEESRYKAADNHLHISKYGII